MVAIATAPFIRSMKAQPWAYMSHLGGINAAVVVRNGASPLLKFVTKGFRGAIPQSGIIIVSKGGFILTRVDMRFEVGDALSPSPKP